VRRLFVRTYVGLLLFVVVAVGAAVAWEQAQRMSGSAPDAVVAAAFEAHPDDDEAALEQIADQLGGRPVLQETPPGGPPFGQGRHPRGKRGRPPGPPPHHGPGAPPLGGPLGLDGPPGPPGAHIVSVPDRDAVVVMRPGGIPRLPWIVGALLVGVGGVIAWQLRPLDRHLAELTEVARRLGAGDRSARAQIPAGAAASELAGGFNHMADEVAQLLSAREELLAAVAHDLKTPLTRLRFAVELLAEETDADERSSQAAKVQGDLDELDTLVAQLLSWGRLDAQVLEPDQVAVAEVLGAAAEAARAVRPGFEVIVSPRVEVVRSDPDLLRRALTNLTVNAARHGAERCWLGAAAVGEQVQFTVDDDGPGIPEESRARVLQPFARLDPSRSGSGTGLGLALVARFALRSGGSVEIEDSERGGARLILALPL